MYVVYRKKGHEIVHVNPAPTRNGLRQKEVYRGFDRRTMAIAETDQDVSEGFAIDESGNIVVPGVEAAIRAGHVPIHPGLKLENGRLVEKTLSELAAEGRAGLNPDQKVVRHGNREVVEPKSVAELVAEGRLELPPDQKVSGKRIVEKTPQELLKEKVFTLEQLKARMIERFSAQAFAHRRELVPDYRLQNAALGIYDEKTAADIRATVQAFRDEFHRLEAEVNKARSAKALEAIKPNYPRKLVKAK